MSTWQRQRTRAAPQARTSSRAAPPVLPAAPPRARAASPGQARGGCGRPARGFAS